MNGAARFPVPVLVIAVTLVAMALLPVWAGVRVNAVEDAVLETLIPARERATELATLHSRQMARFQEYMLTGSREARGQYDRLVAAEGEVQSTLRTLLEPMDLRIRALVLPVSAAATSWQIGHVDALTAPGGRETFLSQIPADQARYDELVAADRELLDALNDEVAAARGRIDDARRLQSAMTLVLILLALAGTVAVGGLARRLQTLVAESRRRQQDAIRTRRAIDAIFAATADGVLSVDLEGGIERINPAAARLLGWSETSARGRELHEVLHGDAHPPEACPVRAAVMEAREVAGEEGEVAVRGTERRIPVLWSVRPLVDGKDRRGGVVTLADLTEIKEAEARLRRAIQAREEVLAVVSHDLRSPLGSIVAGTELLLDVPLDEEKRRRHLTTIASAADRMNRLIEDLLDLALIDSGRLSVRRRPTAVRTLLEEARDAVAVEARERGVVVTWDGTPTEATVRVDPDRVGQVLQNLIGNALRHTPRGGRIGLGARVEDGRMELSVSDTGSGIPESHLDHLFDRFWREDEARRGGAGLGLAIVKGIAEAHGGEVSVESREGEGTTFRVTLPEDAPR